MLRIDFTQHKEPFELIRGLMKGYSEEEIQEAHERFCEYLNVLVRIYKRKVDEGEIESESLI